MNVTHVTVDGCVDHILKILFSFKLRLGRVCHFLDAGRGKTLHDDCIITSINQGINDWGCY